MIECLRRLLLRDSGAACCGSCAFAARWSTSALCALPAGTGDRGKKKCFPFSREKLSYRASPSSDDLFPKNVENLHLKKLAVFDSFLGKNLVRQFWLRLGEPGTDFPKKSEKFILRRTQKLPAFALGNFNFNPPTCFFPSGSSTDIDSVLEAQALLTLVLGSFSTKKYFSLLIRIVLMKELNLHWVRMDCYAIFKKPKISARRFVRYR